MGWDKKCRYKVLGYLIPFEGSLFFVFDLNVKQTFNEKPKKGEEPVDENGEPIQVDTRKGYFSEDILHTFGVPMDQHKAETEVTEMDGFVNIAMLTGPAKAGSAGETVKEAPDQEHQKNHVGTQRYPGQGEEKGQWEATGGSALF